MNAYRVFFLVLFYFFFSGARVRAFDDALLTLSDPVNVLLKKFERYKLQLFSRVIVGTVLFFLARRAKQKKTRDRRFSTPTGPDGRWLRRRDANDNNLSSSS